MVLLLLLLNSFFHPQANAQIANASFFPSMRSINPGVPHLRKSGFMAVDINQTKVHKHQDVVSGGILNGVNTDVTLDKRTVFRAGKGPGFTIAFLFDQEAGETIDSFETATYDRSTTTTAKSTVMGGTIDLGIIGISISKAKYTNFLDYNVGSVPSLNRLTHETELDYNLMRVGTAFEFKGYSIGAFYSTQTAEGKVDSILYNPSTGAKNTPEVNDLEYETTSYGLGAGYLSNKYHFELSFENISKQSLEQSNTYLVDVTTPAIGSRVSLVAEVKFGKIGLGVRYRKIEGNFSDLEQLISSNMLYQNVENSDSRSETGFNFSYGEGSGISLSGFYSSSVLDTEEVSPMFQGETTEYVTETTTTAFGVTVSYVY